MATAVPPGSDLALLWGQRYGWADAVETHAGDLVVLSYLAQPAPVPEPRRIVRFVADLRAGEVASTAPPVLLPLSDHELSDALAPYRDFVAE